MRFFQVGRAAFKIVFLTLSALAHAHAMGSPGRMVVHDVTGTDVVVPAYASRIVTLAPSLGELAAEFAGPRLERIVGVSEFTDFPPALASRSSVGPYSKFNIERVLALKPDLVLATTDGNNREQIQRLRQLGVTVVVVSTSTFAEIEQSVQIVARSLGESARGDEALKRLTDGVKALRERSARRPTKPAVLLQLADQPLMVAGGGTFLNEALTLVGGTNIFADLKQAYPKPSLEEVLRRDPDRILVLAIGGDPREFESMASRWKVHARLKAVRGNHVHIVHADGLLRPSTRLLDGLATLERYVHGDR